ncbi:hypothetical protein [Methylobacterium sp. AMS5]|uniref:hypothetical protein n=1 Tax=Methylobacterium sp. AMS5 TaxID=925818 RepID=UPI00074F833A|nr:hypothetical protein [Methylobacterium sp. AMS5]AMB48379.1 hypothetical protein Y590_25760 [Methylobacterium sp. AMS5]
MIHAKDPEVAQVLTELLDDQWRYPYRTRQGEKMMRAGMARILDRYTPNVITEAAYWRSPTQVFTGATWLGIGIAVGLTLGAL